MIHRIALIAALLIFTAPALAQHAAPERSEGADRTSPSHNAQKPPAPSDSHKIDLTYAHPELPPYYATWAGAMLIVILGMFIAAAVIGPVVRAEMPEEVPDAHSHDDPHGASDTHAPAHH